VTAPTLAKASELPAEMSVDELSRLDAEAFVDYVHAALTSSDHFIGLNQPPVAQRTVDALGDLIRDLQQTAVETRQELGEVGYRQWWAEFGGPLEGLLQRRLARSKGAARNAREVALKREIRHLEWVVRRYGDALGRLAEEIHHHRIAAVEAGFEPELHDRNMWAALAALSVPLDGELVPLDEALGSGLIGGAP
jgi:hypothetical protein